MTCQHWPSVSRHPLIYSPPLPLGKGGSSQWPQFGGGWTPRLKPPFLLLALLFRSWGLCIEWGHPQAGGGGGGEEAARLLTLTLAAQVVSEAPHCPEPHVLVWDPSPCIDGLVGVDLLQPQTFKEPRG